MVNIMNKLLLAGTALLTFAAGTAMAADMAPKYTKAPPMVAAYSWTGCYIGGTIGGAFGVSRHTATSGPFSGQDITPSFATSGEIGGGTLGCNYEFGGGVVLGAEGDWSWTNYKGNTADLSPPFLATAYSTTTQNWLATERVRLGYAWDAAKDGSTGLVFLTGGAAEASVGAQVCVAVVSCASVSNTQTGWVVGGGLEIPIYRTAWIFKFDYLYANLGTSSFSPGTVGGVALPTRSVHVDDNIVRVGLNYLFNWGGPVVARY
jgi:outer membrane immunogenic protein